MIPERPLQVSQGQDVRSRLLIGFACLSIAAACGDPKDTPPSVDEAAPTLAEAVEAEPAPEPAAPEIRTLDDLLPEDFGVLVEPWTGDLDGMVERRIIRTLVISGSPQFFYYQGKPRGIVAELLTMLQKDINASLGRRLDQVEIVPMPVSRDRLIPALLSGQADLIAADLTITDERAATVDFSRPFVDGVDEIVVFAPGHGGGVSEIDDLAGRSVFVRRSSSYFEHLTQLNADFERRGLSPVILIEANESLRPGDILEMVDRGLVPATVIDSYKAYYWSDLLTSMEVRDDLVLRAGGQIAWAFRQDSPALAEAINRFVPSHREGTLIGNVLIGRYMENLEWIKNSTSESGLERVRPLLELFRSAGSQTQLDPLMLLAQAFQESELDHDKRSGAGAVGIMQIKPSTAADRNVGIEDISSPAENIRAGAIYLRFLMDRYFSDEGIDPIQQWFFGLAAYNAGPARIQRLRNQAAREGLDPNRWVENVELVVARKIGRETVRYVRNVFKYYISYRLAFDAGRERTDLEMDL
jgi:membrane-bound lytic murein transglycosylase MltF